MPILRHRKHEIIAQELAAGKSAEQASEIAGYDIKKSSFASTSRKRAWRADIQARKDELVAAAAKNAGLTAEYMLARLKHMSEFNVDDYLSPPDAQGRRFFDVTRVPRDVLARLSELQIEETKQRRRGKTARAVLRTKIKGYDPIAAFTLGARMQGFLRDKIALTDPTGEHDTLAQVLREIDGKSRGLPSASEQADKMATDEGK